MSSSLIFLVTGLAKLASIGSTHSMLEDLDPVFGVSFRTLFLVVGSSELLIGVACHLSICVRLKLGLLCAFSSCILLYRLAVYYGGWNSPCNCMGVFAANITPAQMSEIMKYVGTFICTGSWLFLVYYQLSRDGRPKLDPR